MKGNNMKKKELEKAILLYESVKGIEILDDYIGRLYREELMELKAFVKSVQNSIKSLKVSPYVDNYNYQYLSQLSETNLCEVNVYYEAEDPETIDDKPLLELVIKFKSFSGRMWKENFVVKGNGSNHRISLEEFDDWVLLINFINDKKFQKAINMPTAIEAALNKLDDIKIIDL